MWLYAPGEGASMWQRCLFSGTMCLGWDNLGDYSRFADENAIREELRRIHNSTDKVYNNSVRAVWDFCHVLTPGDVIYVKKGLYKLLGKGIVTGDYMYDESLGKYCNIRSVRWERVGEWQAPEQLVQKTLTDITDYDGYAKRLDDVVSHAKSNGGTGYWWVVARPAMWSFANLPVGETEEYTLYNENGNQRRVFQNFLDAREGDKIIGYESNPVKQIVALGEVSRPQDGKVIQFRKTEALVNPIDYSDFKDMPELADMQFMQNPNGSLFRLTPEEYERLLDVIREANPIADNAQGSEDYTELMFIAEVFMAPAEYMRLKNLLLRKKNVILQGAPGVGKTFAARRLADAIMGEKDDSRVEMVQFHQNTTYEDFIMGYKPAEDGAFRLERGIFYDFCKRAANDPSRPYFFIIDEINRGNLSKIFGELLQLIEADYRDCPIRLAYKKTELFSVPSNVHIIGMMNTADRSLALMDYALRRRFSFFDMRPGFDTSGFKRYVERVGSDKLARLVEEVKALNIAISEDDFLGEGFAIGHSYLMSAEHGDADIESIVEYDLLPMLREYWFDSPELFNLWAERLRSAVR